MTIEGFIVRGCGKSLDHEDTGILIESGPATIRGNQVEDSLFGIYVKDAAGTQVVDNLVTGKSLPIARRGDGIRAWYSNDILIEGNTVRNGRDVIIWYSDRSVMRDNFFNSGRYGLHLMFSNQTLVEGNSLQDNSIGLYVMYSRDVSIVGNTLANNRTAGGQGLGFKDVDNARLIGNRFVNNSIGAQIDNSPSEIAAQNLFQGNVFAFNEIGLALLPNVRQNTFTENTFSDNIQNVSIQGGGQLKNVSWSLDGVGNFWSDYAGYDADGDGIGDIPYRSQRLFESLTDDNEELRLFLYSPAEIAIDFSAKAFPGLPSRVETGR